MGIVIDAKKYNRRNQSDMVCLVDGCGEDVSRLKCSNRRFRMCQQHLLEPELIIGDQSMRFCHQCARLHSVDLFVGYNRCCKPSLIERSNKRKERLKQAGKYRLKSTLKKTSKINMQKTKALKVKKQKIIEDSVIVCSDSTCLSTENKLTNSASDTSIPSLEIQSNYVIPSQAQNKMVVSKDLNVSSQHKQFVDICCNSNAQPKQAIQPVLNKIQVQEQLLRQSEYDQQKIQYRHDQNSPGFARLDSNQSSSLQFGLSHQQQNSSQQVVVNQMPGLAHGHVSNYSPCSPSLPHQQYFSKAQPSDGFASNLMPQTQNEYYQSSKDYQYCNNEHEQHSSTCYFKNEHEFNQAFDNGLFSQTTKQFGPQNSNFFQFCEQMARKQLPVAEFPSNDLAKKQSFQTGPKTGYPPCYVGFGGSTSSIANCSTTSSDWHDYYQGSPTFESSQSNLGHECVSQPSGEAYRNPILYEPAVTAQPRPMQQSTLFNIDEAYQRQIKAQQRSQQLRTSVAVPNNYNVYNYCQM